MEKRPNDTIEMLRAEFANARKTAIVQFPAFCIPHPAEFPYLGAFPAQTVPEVWENEKFLNKNSKKACAGTANMVS